MTDRTSSLSKAAVTIDKHTIVDADEANDQEHRITLRQALQLYPKAIFWSVVLSGVVIQEGYDTKLLSALFARPAFAHDFGQKAERGYKISAAWQAGLGNGSSVGQLFGLLIAGHLTERYGYRRTKIAGLLASACCIFIPFFAQSLTILEVGQVLFGECSLVKSRQSCQAASHEVHLYSPDLVKRAPLGFFQVTTAIYALEGSPTCLAPYLTNYIAMCWSFGHLISAYVLGGTLHINNHWAYRIPFTVQWFWPALLIPLIWLAPESPWWLVRQGRLDEAKLVVKRLTSPAVASRSDINFDVDKNIAFMVMTTAIERRFRDESSYIACFKGTNLRRTFITVMIYCIQTFNGNPMRSYSTYFLKQAGLPTDQAFNMSIGGYCLSIEGVMFSWVLLPLAGRRTIYVWALVLMCGINLVISALGVISPQES